MLAGLGSAARRLPQPPGLKRTLRPPRLKKGDTVGLISPGSFVPDEGLQKAVARLEDFGLKVKPGANIRAERGYTAGTDEQRLSDLHAMFSDPGVSAVWCVRGGYGCSRLLPAIDYRLIRSNPKILIGYSDITALLQAIHSRTGLVGFHGPLGVSEFDAYSADHLHGVLMEGRVPYTIAAAPPEEADPLPAPYSLVRGTATGQLAGGNLSLLAAMAGTDYSPDFSGKIAFIEEVGEKPYRIDRMLTQLRQACHLDKAAGIALGVFNDCEPQEGDRSLSLKETLADRLGGLGIPVVYGLTFGHISRNCVLPVGIRSVLDTEQRTITLLENPVD